MDPKSQDIGLASEALASTSNDPGKGSPKLFLVLRKYNISMFLYSIFLT